MSFCGVTVTANKLANLSPIPIYEKPLKQRWAAELRTLSCRRPYDGDGDGGRDALREMKPMEPGTDRNR